MPDIAGEYLLDAETDGFLEDLTKVFSLVIRDLQTGIGYSCCDDPTYVSPNGHTVIPIAKGLAFLKSLPAGSIVVAHNAIKFDLPALKKVFPELAEALAHLVVRDTLLMSRLIFPEMRDNDFRNMKRNPAFPKKLIGRHSLESWGHRLGEFKDSYTGGFEAWSPSMQTYCEQDVEVLGLLWKLIKSKNYAARAVQLEHDFAEIIFLQEQFGFPLDEKYAAELYATMCERRLELEASLMETFGAWWTAKGITTPKKTLNYKDVARASIVAGASYTKIVRTEFNPSSRDHIAARLIKLRGWQPTTFTAEGKPKVDEDTLADLKWPEAVLFNEYLMLDKRIAQLSEGKQGWLKLAKNGRLHGYVETVGAVTRRCTHKWPNVAQAPSIKNAKGTVPFGKEMRTCLTTIPGYKLVGCDASGLELRCLAHYMARYDGGVYTKAVTEGDVHTVNMEAAGLDSRDRAKRFIYAFLYGAGDAKIGSIIEKGAKAGKVLKTNFLKRTPALKRLKDDIADKVRATGRLRGIDGGTLVVRHQHAALNTLLQSAGAIVMKLALVLLYRFLTEKGWVHGVDYAFVANVHDEFQAVVREDHVDEYKLEATQAIRDAGELLGFRCPLDGDAKEGRTWADTH